MEHFSQETIEKFVRGEFPYQRLLEISAHLVACKNDCQRTLNHIDPDFLGDAEKLEEADKNTLANEAHFSDAEIEGYVLKKHHIEKRLEMNRHFTKCHLCSTKLKDRDPDYLSSFIKDNLNKSSEPEMIVTSEEKGLFLKGLVPAAAFSMLILLSLVIIFLLPNNQTSDQAKVEEFPANNASNKENNKSNKNFVDNNKEGSAVNTNVEPKNESGAALSKPVSLPPTRKQTNQPKNHKSQDVIVGTRSIKNNCENNPNLAITPKDEIITDIQPNLSWKPFPNAVSYKIYLSDSANNLVETIDLTNSEKTSYKITNKLEINKKYEWKVVATLKDGKEVYSEAANFSVGEKPKKLLSSKGNNKVNEIRCLKP